MKILDFNKGKVNNNGWSARLMVCGRGGLSLGGEAIVLGA